MQIKFKNGSQIESIGDASKINGLKEHRNKLQKCLSKSNIGSAIQMSI